MEVLPLTVVMVVSIVQAGVVCFVLDRYRCYLNRHNTLETRVHYLEVQLRDCRQALLHYRRTMVSKDEVEARLNDLIKSEGGTGSLSALLRGSKS